MFSRGLALVVLAEEVTILQFGYHQIDKIAEAALQVGRVHEETVDAVAMEPCLHVVGDVDRRADQRPLLARAGETLVNLADRELLFPGPPDDVARRALARERPVALVNVGKRAVEVIFRQIEVAELVGQHFKPDIRVDFRLQEAMRFPGFLSGAADDRVSA